MSTTGGEIMRRIAVLAVGLLAALAVLAAPAVAGHSHHLDTPGTCVEGLGAGQPHAEGRTWAPGQGKFFHSGLHVGTPGDFAFGQGGQVSVDGGDC
jgi:hypothetical protein